MNRQRFRQLVEAARDQAPDPDDAGDVARRASARPATRPAAETVAAQQVLWDLMADSCTNPLWAAAYVINGGCSDDGFDCFRGWLIAQGREVFGRAAARPDALADLPVVRASAADGHCLECEEVLSIVWNARIRATGRRLAGDAFTLRYPELDPTWDFDFDDHAETTRRLPRPAALHLE